jgi:hypothetical protein
MPSDMIDQEVGGSLEEELDLTNGHLHTLADVTLNPTLKVRFHECIYSIFNNTSDQGINSQTSPVHRSLLFFSLKFLNQNRRLT